MQLNILEYREQCLTAKKYLGENIHSAKAKKTLPEDKQSLSTKMYSLTLLLLYWIMELPVIFSPVFWGLR